MIQKRVLLGSGGYRTPERVQLLRGEMQRHFGKCKKILFIPYALADHERYVQSMIERGIDAGYELDSIHRHEDPVRAIRDAEGVFIGGGNTFRLLNDLYRFDLIEAIRNRVLSGMPYLGVSAGSNVACPTIQTTNDMPIVVPPSFDALNLVPFQLNPHYYFGAIYVKSGDQFVEHFGETRDDRLREFHEMNARPVIGLWEAGLLRVTDNQVELVGTNARIFERDQVPRDLSPGARFDADSLSPL